MPSRTDTSKQLDLEALTFDDASNAWQFSVPSGCDLVRFKARVVSGSFAGGEITAKQSLDGVDWEDLDEPLVIDSVVSSTPRYLDCVREVRLEVTAAQEGTDGIIEVLVAMDSTGLGALRWTASSEIS